MNERSTSGPKKTLLLTTFALVALAAGPAGAQPSNDEKAGENAAPPADAAGAVKPAEVPAPGAYPPPPPP